MKIALQGFGVVAAWMIASTPVRAQCLQWDERFIVSGFSDFVDDFHVFDDGSGPALYAAGNFQTAGGVTCSKIAKGDGVSWSPLGIGAAGGTVHALESYDDGSGAKLYAGGFFFVIGGVTVNGIGQWDGANWLDLAGGVSKSGGGIVYAMEACDIGTGPALYVGGDFTSAGAGSANHIARWDGSSWSALGTGLGGIAFPYASSLALFDDGSGPALFVAGEFLTAGGTIANHIARWNGSSWSALGTGMDDVVESLCVFDDGSGAALYAGGRFTLAGGVSASGIARWDGFTWSAVGAGVNGVAAGKVVALSTFDDGSGEALYAGGYFTMAGGSSANRIAKWDGSTWSALGTGVTGLQSGGSVRAIGSFDAGSGAALYVGGDLLTAGSVSILNFARWDGATWSTDGSGMTDNVLALAVLDDGNGSALYAGGEFRGAGGAIANRVAKFDGTSWSSLGGGVSGNDFEVRALAAYDAGAGPDIYAGGSFVTAGGVTVNNIGRWNGSTWSHLDGGTTNTVHAMAVFDDGSGPALFVGGEFSFAGPVNANFVAKWNGTVWSALGTGVNNDVFALAVHDDGSGPALYAGGAFTMISGNSVTRIAKWNGSTWSALGTGANASVRSLLSFDDGSGQALFAGGQFATVGGVGASRIARWNGSTWSALGLGANSTVFALAAFDDGSGPVLCAGGSFTAAGGATANRLARWDGSAWSAMNTSMAGQVNALASFDDGADGATDLYAGGTFNSVDATLSSRIAELHGCEPGEPYCFGDGIDSVVTALCPCGNFGDAGRGCANSNAALGGGRLFASGTTSPNTLLFTCEGIPNNTFATFLRSSATDDAGFVFGDGIKCLNGTGIRFGSQNAGQGGNPPNTVISAAASVAIGNTRYYQLHYRNPNAGFCPPETFNISNGYRVMW